MSRIPGEPEKRISLKFQERIRALLDDENCNEVQFAKLVNVSAPVIYRATDFGIIPSLRPLLKIVARYDYPLLYLTGDIDDPTFYKADNPSTFHIRLDELVAENNTKYSKIAHYMPFTKNFIYEWQRKKVLPCLDYLKLLANYFKVSPDYLLGRTDYRK